MAPRRSPPKAVDPADAPVAAGPATGRPATVDELTDEHIAGRVYPDRIVLIGRDGRKTVVPSAVDTERASS